MTLPRSCGKLDVITDGFMNSVYTYILLSMCALPNLEPWLQINSTSRPPYLVIRRGKRSLCMQGNDALYVSASSFNRSVYSSLVM